MLFHSPEFLFGFLPVSLLVFYLTARRDTRLGILWLLVASVAFYAWWDWRFLAVLVPSMAFNFLTGEVMRSGRGPGSKAVLVGGILTNVVALGVFKYTAFAVVSFNWLAGTAVSVPQVELPLGISFFTFTQIAYLVDVYKGKASERDPVGFGLFVTFFPHLIAGPILHHAEMMPQFRKADVSRVDWARMQGAAALFLLGLFKKLVLADSFAQGVGPAFDTASTVSFVEAWSAILCYHFQLYFDFSGYTDMAIGLGLMFNIKLPENFNSPYRALSIQDFWNRWHMTLSRFLRDYIYIPLGGNRHGTARTLFNLFMVFLIGGLWHGAGWTFVLWGAMHGVGMVVNRVWQSAGLRLNKVAAWFVTFLFINLSWALFRAENWSATVKMLRGMLGFDGFVLPQQVLDFLPFLRVAFTGQGTMPYLGGGTIMGFAEVCLLLVTGFALTLWPVDGAAVRKRLAVLCVVMFPFVLQALLFKQTASPFLYFRF